MRIDVEPNDEKGSQLSGLRLMNDRIPVHQGEVLLGYATFRLDGQLELTPELPSLAEANETSSLAAAREMVLAQLTRAVEMRLHRGDLVNLAASPELSRAARAAAEAVLDLAVLLPPGWSLEWLQDPQERIPVAQAEPVTYPTAGRAAGLIRYHLQNADIGEADRAELAAFADILDVSTAADQRRKLAAVERVLEFEKGQRMIPAATIRAALGQAVADDLD